MKVDIDTVQLCLHRNGIDARQTAHVINDLLEQAKLEQAERQAEKEKDAQKFSKLCIVANDPDGALERVELTGFILALPEEASEFDLPNLISAAAQEYNRTKKGRRCPVNSVREAVEAIPNKFAKAHGFAIKTKYEVFILPVAGAI